MSAPGADCVVVWRVQLEDVRQSVSRQAGLFSLLSAAEQDRATRFKADSGPGLLAQQQFIAARGTLRILLGHALRVPPRSVELRTGKHGKPGLAGTAIGLDFNVAHSGDLILIALSRCGPVGVDVERVDPAVEAVNLARASFTPREARMVESPLTREDRARAFYRCWTQKEAVTKADGRGLMLPLDSFDVMPGASGRVVVPASGNPDGDGLRTDQNYVVQELLIGGSYAAAIAVGVSYGNTRNEIEIVANAFPTSTWDDASQS